MKTNFNIKNNRKDEMNTEIKNKKLKLRQEVIVITIYFKHQKPILSNKILLIYIIYKHVLRH